MGKTAANYDNTGFRYRNNNGSETTATWVYAVDTNGQLTTDTTYRMRIEMTETNGGTSSNVNIQWEYNLASGGWNSITTSSSVVKAVTSGGNFTEGDDCTQQLGGGGTFLSTNAGMTEDGLTGNHSMAANNLLETELCFQIVATDVSDGQTLELRATAVGEVNAYTTTPSITIDDPIIITCTAATLASAGQAVTVDNGDILYIASASAVETSGAASLTISYPGGLTADDVAVATIQWNGSPGSYSPPTGWTQLAAEEGISNPKSWALYRVCTGSEGASETFNWTNSITSGGIISLYRRVDTSTPIDVSAQTTAQGTASASTSLTGVTTVTNNAMVIMGIGPNSSSVTHTPDAPVTERAETATGGKMASHGSYIKTTAGATGSITGTFSASREYTGWVSALRPASNNVTITCSAATLASAGQAATITPGAVSITCTEATLASAGQTVSIDQTINCSAATLVSAGETTSVVPGAVTIQCTEAILASAGQTANVIPGAVTVSCTEATLASAGQSATISNVTTITCTAATLASAGETATITPGAVTVTANAGVLASVGQATNIVPGAVSVACTSVVLASSGHAATVESGASTINCTVAILTSAGQATSITPGAVTLSAAIGAITATGQSASIIPGAVTISGAVATLSSSGYTITLDTPVTIATMMGALSLLGQSSTITPGAVSITCTEATLASAGQAAVITAVSPITQVDSDNIYIVPARNWFFVAGSREWIYTTPSRDWIFNTASREWIYVTSARNWIYEAED